MSHQATIAEICKSLRAKALDLGEGVLLLKKEVPNQGHDGTPEMHANIMLAYRHLEDARMRLGKVIQAYDGGTSVYGK